MKSLVRLVVWVAGLILATLWAKAHASMVTRTPLWSGEFWQGMTLVVVFCWMIGVVVHGTFVHDLRMMWRFSDRYKLAQLRARHERLHGRYRALADTCRELVAERDRLLEARELVNAIGDPEPHQPTAE
jgi:hypothetical protein